MNDDASTPGPVGSPVDRGVGRLEPERAEDRTLLALAAAAANIPCKGWCQPGARTDGWHGMYTGSDDDGAYARWNPLTDDGDALRLACALGLVVDCSRPSAVLPFFSHGFREIDAPNTAQGVRRAIVRAAAALGAKKTPNAN